MRSTRGRLSARAGTPATRLPWRRVVRDHCTGADHRVFADRDAAENRGAAADGRAAADCVGTTVQSAFVLQPSIRGGAGPPVIDEHHAVADEHVVLDRHPFTDERVRLEILQRRPMTAFF